MLGVVAVGIDILGSDDLGDSGRRVVSGTDQVGLIAASACLLYTSDAADDLLCVDLGGRRIIKQKKE